MVDEGILPAGNISSAITDLIHVAEFVPAMVEEPIAVLTALPALIVELDSGLQRAGPVLQDQ